MKVQDVMRFKGVTKDVLVTWMENKIDEMLPEMHKTRALLKRGAHNWVAMKGRQVDSYLDAVMLMVSDESGNIDSDVMVDAFADFLDELPQSEIAVGPFSVTAGKGEIVLGFPGGNIGRMMFGELQAVRLSRKDIQEIKKLLNEFTL